MRIHFISFQNTSFLLFFLSTESGSGKSDSGDAGEEEDAVQENAAEPASDTEVGVS